MASRKVNSTITLNGINFLIFRYLLESGHVHSAFIFGNESQVVKSGIDGSQIPPHALISFVELGKSFVRIEETLHDSNSPGHVVSALDGATSLPAVHKCLLSHDFKIEERVGMTSQRNESVGPVEMDVDDKKKENNDAKLARNMGANSVDVHESDMLMLKGHSSAVLVGAWNPKASVLATGSTDSTVRLWNIGGIYSRNTEDSANASKALVLHPPGRRRKSPRKTRGPHEVISLDWNPSGTLLSTGSYNGLARVWLDNGTLKHTFVKHAGPLLCTKWNKDGKYVVVASLDHTTSVWNAENGRCVKHFKFHNGPTLDVDWKDDITFASCSIDKRIYVCSLESSSPKQVLKGHKDEINCLKFDPSGTLLASSSGDCTAKIWSSRTSKAIRSFQGHSGEVCDLQWCPCTSERLVLATASYDEMIKLWDVKSGSCMKTLVGHTEPVYSLAYSPNGQYLASGSSDGCLNVWNGKDGTLLKRFRGDGAVFEVAWSPKGDMVSAAFDSSTVAVFDVRKMNAHTESSEQ